MALCRGVNVRVPVGAPVREPTAETLGEYEALPEKDALPLGCGEPLALPEGEPDGRDQALREREAEALLEGLFVIRAFDGDIVRDAATVAQAEALRVAVGVTEEQGVLLAVPLRCALPLAVGDSVPGALAVGVTVCGPLAVAGADTDGCAVPDAEALPLVLLEAQ